MRQCKECHAFLLRNVLSVRNTRRSDTKWDSSLSERSSGLVGDGGKWMLELHPFTLTPWHRIIARIELDPGGYGSHSLAAQKATLVYKRMQA
jgi:hypothetical protein